MAGAGMMDGSGTGRGVQLGSCLRTLIMIPALAMALLEIVASANLLTRAIVRGVASGVDVEVIWWAG